jgi:hypothetical protein
MKRLLTTATLAAIAAGAMAAPASVSASSTTTIKLPRYHQTIFPAVRTVRAENLPRLTDGYAPRWLVASTAVGLIQHDGTRSRVCMRGARWDAGCWRVRHRFVFEGMDTYDCYTVSQGAKRLVFRAGPYD